MKRLNILLIFVLLSSGVMAAPLTPYYLPKKGTTGSETVDSQIYDTGAYVGIGTNAPTQKLHVNGNILVDGQNTLSMGNHMLITGLSNAVGAAPGGMLNVGDNNWLLFNNNVNMYMSDDGARSDGSYKIGWEPTKDYTLAKEQAGQNSQFLYANIYGDYTWGEHVNLNTTADGARAFIAGLHATNTKGYSVSMDDINNTATAFIVYQGGTNANSSQKLFDIRASENWISGAVQGTFTGKVFNYNNALENKFFIDYDGSIYTAGRIGIGTYSPATKISIGIPSSAVLSSLGTVSDAVINSTANNGALFIAEQKSASGPTTGASVFLGENDGAVMLSGDRLGTLGFFGSSSSVAVRLSASIEAFAEANWADASAYHTNLRFSTSTSTSRTERMRITGSGNVGIGTTTVGAKLDIGGGSKTYIDGTDDILLKGDIEIDGAAYIGTGYLGGKATCYINGRLGYCSSTVDASGNCTCN